MKYISIITLSILIISCKMNDNVCGEYESKRLKPNKTTKMAYVKGTNLKLGCDSSFEMTNCGNIIKGKWKSRNDSIILQCESNRFRNDSLNKIRTPAKCKELYFIRKNRRELISIIDSSYKGYVLADLLKKK